MIAKQIKSFKYLFKYYITANKMINIIKIVIAVK
jgi:hypothetical protein